ncbi:MAG: ATP-binding protein [Candidatus Omnitrophota bacterium]
MKIKSFKLKLIFSYVIIILIPLALIAFFLDKSLEENSLRNIESSLVTQARLVETQLPLEKITKEDGVSLTTLIKKLSKNSNCRITVIDAKGKVLSDSEKNQDGAAHMENHSNRAEIKTAMSGSIGIDIRHSPTLKVNMLYAALPIQSDNVIIGVLRLSVPLQSVQKTLFKIRKIVFLGMFFAVCFAFILGSIVASRVVAPINKMIQVSRRFSEGDFSRRIYDSSQDEIGELAATLNRMAEEIENKIKEIGSQNQKLAAIFNSMIEGIIVVDNTGSVISVNPAIEKIFGVSAERITGKAFLETVRNNEIFEIITGALRAGQPMRGEITLLYPVHRIFEISATPIFNNNTVAGCLAVIHDITEIRKLETMRKDFVANVSHELKTPLTSIKGFVETLLDGALDDKENSRSFLKIVQEHTERLDTLVNDLLVLSSLESKEIVLNKEEIDLEAELTKVVLGFKAQLKKKNIEVKNEVRLHSLLKADRNRVEQVLTNLIDNAIKFNKDKGFIRIYADRMDNKIKITFEDSGFGIPAKDLLRIFERFYRVDKARSRELGGTGLGLSIVKHIVELHGGSVGVESAEGVGSKFWFTLPL